MTFPPDLDIPADVLEIARRLEGAGHEAWCVGGAIRDNLLGQPNTDYDVATSAPPDEVRRLFRRTVPVGERFGTVAVRTHGRQHEVTTFRKDVQTDGRHAVVEYGVSLDEDLARRDFTINAIAYHPLRHEWRDPCRGSADLDRRVIRAVGDPASRFREDYLRVLRAIRFAARFDFSIDPATWAAMQACAEGLTRLSAERVREEWFKGLKTARSLARLVELWTTSGAARVWLPELLPAPAPGAERAADLPRDPVLLTALLCRDPVAVLERLKASNAEIGRAAAIRAGPAQPEGSAPVAVRRWMAAVEGAADDLTLLRALRQGTEAPWAAELRGIRERGEPLSRRQLAVRGGDLEQIGVPHGPRMGEILDRLLEAVLDDPSLNTRDALLARARALL
jgi:tRNA nucleotidyltransferase (CCA-adding enzyme)